MPAGYASPTNTFVPSHEATGGLIIGFSRNPKRFKINLYRQVVPVDKPLGLYLALTTAEAGRLIDANDEAHIWPDGHDAPTGVDELESFRWVPYQTERRAYPFTLGNIAIEAASWNIVAFHAAVAAQKAMTAQTMLAVQALKGASWGDNTGTPASIVAGGKTWANGSTGVGSENDKHILMCFNHASAKVNLATLGVVQPNEMICVVNPNTAKAMSESPEIQQFVAQSPFALAQLRGDVPSQNGQWGLPDVLYNHPIVVEDAVRVTTPKKADESATKEYVLGNGDAFFLSRPGELVGQLGAPAYSTLQTFFYKDEMTAYIKNDPDHERTAGRVVSNYAHQVTSVLSGFYFSSVLG